MKCSAFLANLGWVGITSQHILPNTTLFLFFFHVLFLFPISIQYLTKRCFANYISCLQRYFGESKPDLFQVCKNFLRPIFSIFISTINVLATLQRLLYIFSTCLVSFGQILQSSLPVFLFDQVTSHYLETLCSSANLTVARNLPRFCFFAIQPKSYFFYFLFIYFILIHPIASLVIMTAYLFSLCLCGRLFSEKKLVYLEGIKLYNCGLHNLRCRALVRVLQCL